jgi:hypothetical protein
MERYSFSFWRNLPTPTLGVMEPMLVLLNLSPGQYDRSY